MAWNIVQTKLINACMSKVNLPLESIGFVHFNKKLVFLTNCSAVE
jgi:hypothetical protein